MGNLNIFILFFFVKQLNEHWFSSGSVLIFAVIFTITIASFFTGFCNLLLQSTVLKCEINTRK